MSSKFQTPKKELSIAIVNELTTLTTAIKSSISEGRKGKSASTVSNDKLKKLK